MLAILCLALLVVAEVYVIVLMVDVLFVARFTVFDSGVLALVMTPVLVSSVVGRGISRSTPIISGTGWSDLGGIGGLIFPSRLLLLLGGATKGSYVYSAGPVYCVEGAVIVSG